MKKFLLAAVITIAASFCAQAQESKVKGTVMSRANAIDYGVFYGYGSGKIANFAGGVFDYNFSNSTLRLRATPGIMESNFCPSMGIDAQYLLKTVGNLYIYPAAGVYGEYHDKKAYDDKMNAGIQAGAGAEYQFCPSFGLFVEGHWQCLFGFENRTAVQAGIICHLGKHKRG